MTDTTTLYRCSGHRAVRAIDAHEAAGIFASREARATYGRLGYVRTIRLDCWTESGRSHTFHAFIGKDVGRGDCAGRDIWVYVDRAEA